MQPPVSLYGANGLGTGPFFFCRGPLFVESADSPRAQDGFYLFCFLVKLKYLIIFSPNSPLL